MLNYLKIMFATAFIYIILPVYCTAQELNFENRKEGVLLSYGNEKLFFYQAKTKSINGQFSRADYIHPLYGLNSEVLTEDFPEDHLHQRGVYWAWHQLYIENKKVGDPWACEGIKWKVDRLVTRIDGQAATLEATVFWIGHIPDNTKKEEKLIQENTLITYQYISEDLRIIEFDIKLTALHDGTRIGGSDDEKGYSGFSVRVKMPDDISFHSEQGVVDPKETAVEAGGWIDITGTFDNNHSGQTCLTMMCDPENPSPFHGWILRSKGSMQNAAFPGRVPVPIRKGESLHMRYRLLLHRPDMPGQEIERIYNEFLNGS